ncbi:hypothetical protein GCM10010404_33290 [Nonomuraea africana]
MPSVEGAPPSRTPAEHRNGARDTRKNGPGKAVSTGLGRQAVRNGARARAPEERPLDGRQPVTAEAVGMACRKGEKAGRLIAQQSTAQQKAPDNT